MTKAVAENKHQWQRSFDAPVYGKDIAGPMITGQVDTEKGIIYGLAVVTVGEAKGHGVSLEQEFVDRTVELGNEKKSGLKSRFGHPNMSSTALGTFIGREKNFRADGPIARADLYLSQECKGVEVQGGGVSLWDYVLGMAKNEPDMLGTSIVFSAGAEYQRDEAGVKHKLGHDLDGRYSLDADYAYDPTKPVCVEIAELHANDMVDDPAANDSGLFSAFNQATLAGQVTEFLDLHPDAFELASKHPEIVDGFLRRYEEYRKRITSAQGEPDGSKEKLAMADETKVEDVAAVPEPEKAAAADAVPAVEVKPEAAAAATPVATAAVETPAEAGEQKVVEEPKAAEPVKASAADPKAELLAEGQRFVKAFGAKGSEWFLAGKSFAEAQELHAAEVLAENAELKKQLEVAKAARGADAPVEFHAAPEGQKSTGKGLNDAVRMSGQKK